MRISELYKFEILLFALFLQLVYPFFSLLFISEQATWHLISFTILIIASMLMGRRKITKILILVFGGISGVALWCGYLFQDGITIYIRIYGTCFFYMTLIYILTRNFIEAESISLQVVIGAMSGYLLIGFFGANIIEMMDFHHPGSFRLTEGHESFDYTYFSFISLVTVGYGDIIPLSSSAKSLTIFISIVGQFYLAVGIASFVGKLRNK